jgi:drug/metabolite transporter superfamily protein YnfA
VSAGRGVGTAQPVHPIDLVSRAAHDLGLAAWFGGAYMGAVALNGASREVDDPTQRARVANAGWFRWAAIVPVAVGAHVGGAWWLTRRDCSREASSSLTLARVAVTAAAMLATVESGRSGRTVAAAGDVPVATAVQPISDTPPEVAAAQRRLRVVQWLIPAFTAGIVVVDAWQRERGDGTRLLPQVLCR